MINWDPQLYMKYGNERTQPSIDLTSRIPLINPQTIVDLGCGSGNSTAILRKRWPEADISGLDSSAAMLGEAQKKFPSLRWIEADIGNWRPEGSYDLIFSNAALQWVPNHDELFSNLLSSVNDSGCLAVQVPYHYTSRLHQIIIEVSHDSRWTRQLDRARNALTSHTPAFYYDLLHSNCSRIDIWQTDYYHIMESPEDILEWISGTGLRPYLDALNNESERNDFKALILNGYREAYPRRKDGKVLFPFSRLFLLLHK